MADMSEEQRRRIEKVYAGAIAFVTVRGEPNMLLVFPNTEEGYSERMVVAQAFSATHRYRKPGRGNSDAKGMPKKNEEAEGEEWKLSEKEDFDEFGAAREDGDNRLPYPALYLPTHMLRDGVDEEIPEMAVLREMGNRRVRDNEVPVQRLHHLHSDIGNEDVMGRLENFLRARDSAEALLKEDKTLTPDDHPDHFPVEEDGLPSTALAVRNIEQAGKLSEELQNAHPIIYS